MYTERTPEKPRPVDEIQANGTSLATITRSSEERIRLDWCEYEGHPYLSIRRWFRGSDGRWYPDRTKGISVRRSELPAYLEAIEKAIELADEHDTSAGNSSAGNRSSDRPRPETPIADPGSNPPVDRSKVPPWIA